MTTISGSLPVQAYNYTPQQTGERLNQDDGKKIVIEVKPGEDNVSSGDRSDNTATISITTPNRELEAQISREQLFNVVERRTKQKQIDQVLGSGSDERSLLKGAIAVESGDFESEDIAELKYLDIKQEQIETYSNATENDPYDTEDDDSSEPSYSGQQYYEAKSAYQKQQFVFDTLDRLGISEEV
jgi:hypothetical protein